MIELDAAQLSRVRFAVSPLWEVGLAALVLRRADPGALFRRWAEQARQRVDATALDGMLTLTAGRDFVPDIFSALPGNDQPDVSDVQAHLRGLPDELLARDLARLDRAHRGGHGWIRALMDDHARAREEIADVVAEFWRGAIAPHWRAFRRLARADIARHAMSAADEGQGAMLDELHPGVAWSGAALSIVGACETSFGPTPAQDGVLLTPSAFAWPRAHVMSNAPFQPAIAYGVRGFATLWESPNEDAPSPAIERLVGAGRARVAAAIATPATTTELAHALGVAPATVNEHLRTLTDARLASAVRDGRVVVYTLTDLGRGLLFAQAR
ncbi:regulatory ArsR family protein [Xylanimonas ulmi]|uniref:Regulatory ArsR family protein n=1 Tax=Xylanimonas ulmi TaxID=228973 RepID=A0A4Q7LYM1_9MICO|nr:regulatory ArsR family protein [Xylanibacterium ulmi]